MSKEYVVIHHSLTEDSGTVSWDNIRDYHTNTLGWSDIGYHFGIEQVDNSVEILMGRMLYKSGAHAKEANMNNIGIGICVVGNYDEVEPNPTIMLKLRELVQWLQMEYGIPKYKVIGHRDVGLMVGKDWTKGEYKSCPGKLFSMIQFKEDL
jgi:N-acetyl-anhydromuramyl-L-alanine amidase AmpD